LAGARLRIEAPDIAQGKPTRAPPNAREYPGYHVAGRIELTHGRAGWQR